MGEVSQMRVSVPKPRPLGLVKRESVHFDEGDETEALLSGKHESWTPGSLALLGRSRTESDLKHEFRSMRDLQETLRQAALLNIVAAVNHDESAVDTVPVVTRTSGSHFVGIKGASILGHTIGRTVNKPLVTASTGEGVSINNFSHNLASVANNMPVASHNSTLSKLLGQRPRTISIPRPRTQNDQGAFMHNSLRDAKEQLSNVTSFRAKSKKEMDSPSNQTTPAITTQDTAPVTSEESKGNSVQANHSDSRTGEFTRSVSCLRGSGFDVGDIGQQNKNVKDASPNPSPKDSKGNQVTNTVQVSKEQQRAQNVHQMQAMKRHISTSKKKELMKKLTDIAKCEAVDIGEPLSSAEANSAPPIIIMSQQKENFPFHTEGLDTRVNRIKSTPSLQDRSEQQNVPSNTRIQSETLESMAQHREAKKKAALNPEDDLRIESINGIESAMGVDGLYRTHRDQKSADDVCGEDHVYVPINSRLDHLFSEGIVGKTVPSSISPDVLELRPLEALPNASGRETLVDRRRPHVRRFTNQGVRDKLMSPSPSVYEASFHRPKASMIQMTLVGQSLPALSGPKVPISSTTTSKPNAKRVSAGDISSIPQREETRTDDNVNKQGGENKTVPLKPWGSIGKTPSVNSPILRTEILDHLQCVGLVNHRQFPTTYKKTISKVNGLNKGFEFARQDSEFDDEEFYDDDDDSSDTSRIAKNMAKYRKSKLYNAFRASEENLSNLVDNSSLVSEAITSRTLLNPQSTAVVDESIAPSTLDPVNQSTKEPLYMGCSSRVSEKELRSQYHIVNDLGEEDSKQTGQFKVMKAIDQDVYFNFQHKKYRKNNESPLNTAPNNPRMHFLKIKFSGEAKT